MYIVTNNDAQKSTGLMRESEELKHSTTFFWLSSPTQVVGL